MVQQTLDAVGGATLHNPGQSPPYPVPVLPTCRSRPLDLQAQAPTQTQSHVQTQTRSEFLTPSLTEVQSHPQSYSYSLFQPRFQSHQQQQPPSTTPSLSTPRQDNFSSFRPDSRRPAVPPASTEVISSLITSLSDYSVTSLSSVSRTSVAAPPSPAPSPALPAIPTTPRHGSFGVDYGVFSYPALDPILSLDDLAAAPPVIRTAKPPSGFSALTAPKISPIAATAGRDPFGSSLKSRLSRPSSRASARDETRSIGNLSIERGLVLPNTSVAATAAATDAILNGAQVLLTQRSHDSWGRNQARNSRGLMYMSSKERLREQEQGKKRTDINTAANNVDSLDIGIGSGIGAAIPSPGFAGSFSSSFPSAGPLRSMTATSPTTTIISMSATTTLALAETPITEEPASVNADPPWRSRAPSPPKPSLLSDPSTTPWRSIPTRDSSLRKVGPHTRRLSRRLSRRLHEHPDGPVPIPNSEKEADSISRRRQQPNTSTADPPHRSAFLGGPLAVVSSTTPLGSRRGSYDTVNPDSDLDDGAPFPAVAQGPATHFARHRSDRYQADHSADAGRITRSGSRIKRLSGRGSPRPDDVLSLASSSVPPPLRGDSPEWPCQHPRHKAQKRSQQGQRQLSEQGGRQSTQSLQHQYQLPAGYERPQSPDSVDDAVESYLCSPRLSQRIRHPQTGRIISFSEVGDSQGSAVFCCVGMGLTRYITAFYDELALTLKLRLITPDRPGVGESESPADGTATPLGWPDDVYTICQALKITKFSILAHSAGAIYALATALRMPQHIRGRIHLLAPWIPPSQMNVFGTSQALPPNKAMPTSQRILRALPTPILKAANSSFMTATSSSITSSLPKIQRRPRRKTTHMSTTPAPSASVQDGRTFRPGPGVDKENAQPAGSGDSSHPFSPFPPSGSGIGAGPISAPSATENMDRIRPSTTLGSATVRPEDVIISAAADALADKERQLTYDIRLTHAIWELATTGANPAVDLLVCLERRHTIGFRYVDITRPVVIHHGSRDTRVPVENVRWLGKMMRRCEVRVLDGEGHGLMASAAVMGAILMEISKEWEDWMRVTGNLNPSPLLASSASGFTSVRRTTVAGR